MKTLRVSSQSKPFAVATSITEIIKAEGEVEVISIMQHPLTRRLKV